MALLGFVPFLDTVRGTMQDTNTFSKPGHGRFRFVRIGILVLMLGTIGCIGIPQQVNPYLYHLRAQAEKGDPEAQYRYGWRCQVGWGVKENKREALWWYRQAAQKNHPLAIFRIGEFYRDGNEVRMDLVEASKWFQVAVRAGFPAAEEPMRKLESQLKPQELKLAKERADEWMLKFQNSKK
jgi:hypothetical protein